MAQVKVSSVIIVLSIMKQTRKSWASEICPMHSEKETKRIPDLHRSNEHGLDTVLVLISV